MTDQIQEINQTVSPVKQIPDIPDITDDITSVVADIQNDISKVKFYLNLSFGIIITIGLLSCLWGIASCAQCCGFYWKFAKKIKGLVWPNRNRPQRLGEGNSSIELQRQQSNN
jgi:hypothetical protein